MEKLFQTLFPQNYVPRAQLRGFELREYNRNFRSLTDEDKQISAAPGVLECVGYAIRKEFSKKEIRKIKEKIDAETEKKYKELIEKGKKLNERILEESINNMEEFRKDLEEEENSLIAIEEEKKRKLEIRNWLLEKVEEDILGEVENDVQVKYIHGNVGRGTYTFLGGHDPEDYQHFIGDPPTDLSLHRNSPGYRLILNNVLFPAARKKAKKP